MTDESWYPAAGSYGGNHIDEPNQQGLSKNEQSRIESKLFTMVFTIIVAYLL